MTRASALGFFLGASALLPSCDIPPATFSDTTTSGSGGAGSSGTAASSGGTGGTGGVVEGPVVPCSYPMVAPCSPEQVCCYDKTGPPYADFCAASGKCNPSSDYLELQCDDNLDCPGQACCAYYIVDAESKRKVQKTYCDDACATADTEVKACLESTECEAPATCKSLFIDYQTYKFCF